MLLWQEIAGVKVKRLVFIHVLQPFIHTVQTIDINNYLLYNKEKR